MKERCECYNVLASCFYLPEKDLLIREKLVASLTSALQHMCPAAAKHSSKMGKALIQYSHEELSVAFSKLFVGPFELRAPPYGSVYTDEGRRIMGDSTVEIQKFYSDAGLTIRDDFKELPDHISIELEFMYYLIFKEIEALEKLQNDRALEYLKNQDIFLNKFLCRWVVPFCKNIYEGTGNNFYRSLADCVRTFVIEDSDRVRMFLDEHVTYYPEE
jgi:TorA maturation chaperone TorD